jgi:peptide/nickel transport system substrate-binding protein
MALPNQQAWKPSLKVCAAFRAVILRTGAGRSSRFARRGLVALVVLVAAACSGRDRSSASGARRGRLDAAVRAGAERPRAAVGPPPAPARALPERPGETPAPADSYGGTLRVHLEAEPPHLNPLAEGHQVIQRVVSGLVYQPLVECGPDRAVPLLADGWEESPDGLRLLLRLRPGVRWHDDRPLTAVDVQASLEPLLRSNSRQPALRALLGDVEAVEVMPDRTVRLRLARPSRLVVRALCEVPILPVELARGPAPAGGAGTARPPVGTGPFRFAGWERGKRIRLLRHRPRAGLQADGAPAGGPYLDEIVFEIDTDGARALARTRRGEIHVLPRLLDLHYPDQVTEGGLRGTLALYRLTPERFSFLAVNHRRPPLGDVRVRQALALLWNRERLAAEVHRGLARPIGAPPFAGAGEGEGGPTASFDRQRAAALLDEAGYRDGNGDGLRERQGTAVRLTLLVPAGSRHAATEGRAFVPELRRAGIALDLAPVDGAAFLTRLEKGEFDLAPMVWDGRGDEDPRALFGPLGELAFTGYRPDALVPLFDELRMADGPVARRPILGRIAEALGREQPVIFLYRHDTAALVSRRVRGLAGSGDRLDLRGVWLER